MIPQALIVKLAVVAVLCAGAAWTGHTWTDRKWSSKWDRAVAAQQTALAMEQRKQRDIELARQADVDSARGVIENAQRQNANLALALARRDADLRGVRQQLTAFGASPAGGDSVTACRSEAGALAEALARGAEVLDRGRRLVAEFAKAHDDRAAEIEGLLAGWPRAD